MTAKEYLMALKKLDIRIKQKKEHAEELRQTVTSTGSFDYSKLKVQASITDDKMGDTIIKIMELEYEIQQLIIDMHEQKNRIINEIHDLDNADYIRLLYMRYVEYLSLEEIAVKMCFSYDRIRHMHGYALQEFQKKMKDDTQ